MVKNHINVEEFETTCRTVYKLAAVCSKTSCNRRPGSDDVSQVSLEVCSNSEDVLPTLCYRIAGSEDVQPTSCNRLSDSEIVLPMSSKGHSDSEDVPRRCVSIIRKVQDGGSSKKRHLREGGKGAIG